MLNKDLWKRIQQIQEEGVISSAMTRRQLSMLTRLQICLKTAVTAHPVSVSTPFQGRVLSTEVLLSPENACFNIGRKGSDNAIRMTRRDDLGRRKWFLSGEYRHAPPPEDI